MFLKLLAEGVSVAAASRQVGVHNTVGYYWAKKGRATTTTATAPVAVRFAELKPSGVASEARRVTQSVEVVVGEASIRVEPGFDAQLLRQVVAVLSGGGQ